MRYFAHERGMELMVTQSYSKNFGLYGERIGKMRASGEHMQPDTT